MAPSSWYSVSSSPCFPPRAPRCSSLLAWSRESFNFTSPLPAAAQQQQQETAGHTHTKTARKKNAALHPEPDRERTTIVSGGYVRTSTEQSR